MPVAVVYSRVTNGEHCGGNYLLVGIAGGPANALLRLHTCHQRVLYMPGTKVRPISVAVLHTDELVRVGVCTILEREADFQVVYEGERLDELSMAVEEGRVPMPRVVLLLVSPPLDPACAAMRRWTSRLSV